MKNRKILLPALLSIFLIFSLIVPAAAEASAAVPVPNDRSISHFAVDSAGAVSAMALNMPQGQATPMRVGEYNQTVGVKAGDWIKYDYNIIGAPQEALMPASMKVEILDVEGTTVTLQLTIKLSNGTENSEMLTLDVTRTLDYDTGGTFDTFFGFQFVIPANSPARYGVDFIYVTLLNQGLAGTNDVGETTRECAGGNRTVVYATFNYQGGRYGQLRFYWDKHTGVMVEASNTLDSMTVKATATQTNIWEATTIEMQWWLWVVIAVAVVAVAFAVYRLKKRKTPATPTPPAESS
jgi:hypothetical protein